MSFSNTEQSNKMQMSANSFIYGARATKQIENLTHFKELLRRLKASFAYKTGQNGNGKVKKWGPNIELHIHK